MDRESVKLAVRTTLMIMGLMAKRTKTYADDLMTSILQRHEERIVDVVMALASSPDQPITEAQVAKALESVGIKV